MNNIENDGIDHINIYSQGKTQLGKMLSNFYKCRINTNHGYFNSVEGYWFWLGLPSKAENEKEILRTLHGYQAKKIGTELVKKYGRCDVEDFNRCILKAIWIKVKLNKHLFTDEYKELPLEHYYNFGGKIVDVKDKYKWMIDGIRKMRDKIYEDR